jgi:hypothetical protein
VELLSALITNNTGAGGLRDDLFTFFKKEIHPVGDGYNFSSNPTVLSRIALEAPHCNQQFTCNVISSLKLGADSTALLQLIVAKKRRLGSR